jgi:hypothetical protein
MDRTTIELLRNKVEALEDRERKSVSDRMP